MLGPQGSGKGTQAELLAAATGGHHISTGDLVRAEIQAGTPLGLSIKAYNDHGELVPDELIVALTTAALATETNWILDGFPRTLAQAQTLDKVLAKAGVALDRVMLLTAPDDLLVERLSGRRQSVSTGRVYHILYAPPPPDDPGPFVQRSDDHPDVIRHRLEIYHTATEPLKRYYERRGLLLAVDASGPIDEVAATILGALRPSRSPAQA
jgi:adenylate kinase